MGFKIKEDFDKKYDAAKAKATVNQQQLKQIRDVEKRISDLKKLQMTNANTVKALGNPETAYKALRVRWNDLHATKIQALDGQCQQFSALSGGLIKAEIRGSLDIEALKQKIKSAFSALNIKEQKIDELCQFVLTAIDPVAAWNGVLDELEKLAFHSGVVMRPFQRRS